MLNVVLIFRRREGTTLCLSAGPCPGASGVREGGVGVALGCRRVFLRLHLLDPASLK